MTVNEVVARIFHMPIPTARPGCWPELALGSVDYMEFYREYTERFPEGLWSKTDDGYPGPLVRGFVVTGRGR